MAHVTVTIAGRPYRMACGDGEEPHLEELARILDGKITELRSSFGEIGDQRIIVMAALTLADELNEAQRQIGEFKHMLTDAEGATRTREAQSVAREARIVSALGDAAQRIERLAQRLNARG